MCLGSDAQVDIAIDAHFQGECHNRKGLLDPRRRDGRYRSIKRASGVEVLGKATQGAAICRGQNLNPSKPALTIGGLAVWCVGTDELAELDGASFYPTVSNQPVLGHA
jgi:hypothetical protein